VTPPARGVRRTILQGAGLLMGLGAIGLVLAVLVHRHPIGRPEPNFDNVFYVLYGLHEPPLLAAFVLFTAFAGAYCGRLTAAVTETQVEPIIPLRPVIVAVIVGIAGWVGSRIVLLGFPLAMDEYSAVFQSRIFAAGKLVAQVPVAWQEVVESITPRFVTYLPEHGAWLSGYLPVYAAMRGLFLKLGAASLLNPLLGALSVAAIAVVGKQLWRGGAQWKLAVVLLATSSQFLFTSMTTYSMPAHLLLSLCWLGLYLDGTRRALIALPWVGVFALGLHNPFPHALFAAPFLLRLARTRGTGLIAYYAVVYGTGCAAWWLWLSYSQPLTGAVAPDALFGFPGPRGIVTQLMSLSLVLSWQTPVFGLGLAVALLRWPRLTSHQKDMAAGVVLTFVFYLFFLLSQGHGWGYRYMYAVLGSAALLAAEGLAVVAGAFGWRPVVRIVAVSTGITLVFQLPMRAMQVRRFVQPFAEATALVRSVPAPVVTLDTRAVWYGQDLVRNDPFLAEPVIVNTSSSTLTPIRLDQVTARYAGQVRNMRPEELERLGLITVRRKR
jgi:hypothetical protein